MVALHFRSEPIQSLPGFFLQICLVGGDSARVPVQESEGGDCPAPENEMKSFIDPGSGLIIGERTLMTYAAFRFGANEVTGHTAIEYQIVDAETVPAR